MKFRVLLILILQTPWLMGDGPLRPYSIPTFRYTLTGAIDHADGSPAVGSVLWFELPVHPTDSTTQFVRLAGLSDATTDANGRFTLIDSAFAGSDSLRLQTVSNGDTATVMMLRPASARNTEIAHDEPGCMSMTYKVVTAEIYNFPDTTVSLPR